MSIPDYQALMLPLMQLADDRKEHTLHEAVESLTIKFKLNDEERNRILPSGQQTYIKNRIGWARTYLKKAGLLSYTGKTKFVITEEGLNLLASNPTEITKKMLGQYNSFQLFQKRKSNKVEIGNTSQTDLTPEEALEYGYEKINESLADDLLTLIKEKDPGFFENLVVELLVKMGYGGSRQEAGEVLGKSGDEGIDGIIKEDKLGLDIIYIQAKRWNDGNTVGRPEIQKFVGALSGQGASKGIFITTSSYSKEAQTYANQNQMYKIVLIDGEKLSELMIEHNLGVSITATYEVKKIDSDYFE